jgi:hypothetical protein
MPSTFSLQALGLNTMSNSLEAPPGSLAIAKNVTIDRDNVVESRRGFKIYGDSFGSTSDRAKQIFSYKEIILRHYGSTLQYDNGSGTFADFAGSYSETAQGLRIKSIESNGNLYFTTSDGIKKISAKTADDFTTASGFITSAGAVKAIDLSAEAKYNYGDQSSFFVQDSAIAYRAVWGYRDANNNLFLGAPSQRTEVYNSLLTLLLQDFPYVLNALDAIGKLGSLIDDQDYVNTLKLPISASASELRDNLIALSAKIDNDIVYGGVTVAATTASFSGQVPGMVTDVQIDADNAGVAGNIALNFDGILDIDTVIANWNGANPGNTVTLTSGDGTQIPNNAEVINLTGGADAIPTAAPLVISSAAISAGVCTITFASGDPSTFLESGSRIFLDGFNPASGILDGAQVVSTVNTTELTFNTTASGVVTIDNSASIVSNTYRSLVTPGIPETPATNAQLVEIQEYLSGIITALNNEFDTVISALLKSEYIEQLDVTRASTALLTISIPEDINSSYFFQIYRSAVFTADDTSVLSIDVAPNDELQLVYEAFPTSTEITAGIIVVEDIVPDAFRGANLYTNAATGEGILQANDLPPFAKDINVFKNSIFYANTRTKQRKDLTLIGVQQMIDDYNNNIIPSLTIATENVSNTYTFIIGENEEFEIETVAGSFLANSGTASYFEVNSGNNEREYYFWFKIGTATDPAISGKIGKAIVATGSETDDEIAGLVRDAFNVTVDDFAASSASNVVSVLCEQVGYTDDATPGTSGFTITIITEGTGEDAALKQVLLSTDTSPARAVEETATSLVRVINKNTSEEIYAYYLSGAQEVPGKILFESRGLNGGEYYIITNNVTTGDSFTPSFAPTAQINSISVGSPTTMVITTASPHGFTNLSYVVISGSDSTPSIDGYHQITLLSPTTFRIDATVTIAGTIGGVSNSVNTESSSNEEAKNRVYYSKTQQPEAVPILNYFDVGAKDRAILRIYPLRDSLFVLKEDGLYRISGESIPFNLALFDGSCIAVAPDSVSSVNNVIYCWTRQGISSITESGVRDISRPIDIDVAPLSSPNYPNFSTATWGLGYESDKSYTVFTVSKKTDTYATMGFKYNNETNTWTTINKDFVCGIINFIDDKMYVGAGDTNFIEQERKSFDRSDYADREHQFEIQSGKYFKKVISLDNVDNIEISDVFIQDQTVTIYDFNMLLKKLDIDPGVVSTDYFSTLAAVPGDNMKNKLEALCSKLDADGLGFTDYESTIDSKSGSITSIAAGDPVIITSASHGLISGRKIIISTSDSIPMINDSYIVTVIDANTFSISPGFEVITPGTTGIFSTLDDDFEDLKICYNAIITKLIADPVVGFNNYSSINKITKQEILITAVDRVAKRITVAEELDYVVGAFTVFKSIDCEIQYTPNTFGGDPISLKHMREAQIMFESLAFTKGTISFATDLLPKFEKIDFVADGNGRFGFSEFGSGFFGGASNSAPIRTYIPRNCQRCRYMVIKFNHRVAREKWSLFGISITGETELSTRSYK